MRRMHTSHASPQAPATRPLRPVRVLLVRHGESEANIEPTIISGRSSHLHLTPRGQAQARALGKWLATQNFKFDRAFCSSAVRAKETAKLCLGALSQKSSMPPPSCDVYDALEEIHMGDWVGKHREHIYTDEMVNHIQTQPWLFAPPNGESQKDVEDRMVAFLNRYVMPLAEHDATKHSKVPLNVIMFGHAVAFKCLLRWVLDSTPERTWKFGIDNTSITEIYWTQKHGWHFMRMNDTSHLAFYASDIANANAAL